MSSANISDDDFVRMNATVVQATKSMLARRDPGRRCTIHLLSTEFYLSDDAPISIGHAVGNAMVTHKVEKAEFTVLTVKKKCTLGDLVNYGTQFVSFFMSVSVHLLNCSTKSGITHQFEHAQLNELSMVNTRFGKVELKWLPRLTRTNFIFWRYCEELPLSFGHVPLLEVVSLENTGRSWHKWSS
jgi:hypothetical protein